MMNARFAAWGIVLASAGLASCTFYSATVTPLDVGTAQSSAQHVAHASKVHLGDGSVVMCEKGFAIQGEQLACTGIKYDLTRSERTVFETVRIEDVAAIEYYDRDLQVVPTVAGSIGAGMLGFAAALAIFGSCPTLYTVDGERETLEAEAFSHSIVKRFASADLDRLDNGALRDGVYRLKLANEALETHYIDQLRLVTVDHPPGYEAFQTEDHGFVLFGARTPLQRATDKHGRDVSALIATRDTQVYRSDTVELEALARGPTEDWIDLEVDVPAGARQATLALRLRNTLLSTVLFYDVMLKGQGAKAIDWQASTDANPLRAWRLKEWFSEHFDLRVSTRDGARFTERARIAPAGPIAWHQVAVALPVAGERRLALRLGFLPDNWTIDWVGVSFDDNRDRQVRTLEARTVLDVRGAARNDLLPLLAAGDERYVSTSPGDSYALEFAPGEVPAGRERTFFASSRGFYIEWLRRDWVTAGADAATPFEPDDAAIRTTAQLWLAKKERFEEQFFATKIPLSTGTPP